MVNTSIRHIFKILLIRCKKTKKDIDASFHMTVKQIVWTVGVSFLLKFPIDVLIIP